MLQFVLLPPCGTGLWVTLLVAYKGQHSQGPHAEKRVGEVEIHLYVCTC